MLASSSSMLLLLPRIRSFSARGLCCSSHINLYVCSSLAQRIRTTAHYFLHTSLLCTYRHIRNVLFSIHHVIVVYLLVYVFYLLYVVFGWNSSITKPSHHKTTYTYPPPQPLGVQLRSGWWKCGSLHSNAGLHILLHSTLSISAPYLSFSKRHVYTSFQRQPSSPF